MTSLLGPQASRLNILSQVAVQGSSWKSNSMFPSPGTGEEGQQNTKLQGVCHLIKSACCGQCCGNGTYQAHSWAQGPDISHRTTLRAAEVLSSTSFKHHFSHMGTQRPRVGKPLARGHTAFVRPNVKCLLCEVLYLGLGIRVNKTATNSSPMEFIHHWRKGQKEIST